MEKHVDERRSERLIAENLRAALMAGEFVLYSQTIKPVGADGGNELVTSFGEKGKCAELVADEACTEALGFLDANVPVGVHLADQLLLPLAIAGGGRYRCAPLSLHATTNIETIAQFLDLPIEVVPDRDAVIVAVG